MATLGILAGIVGAGLIGLASAFFLGQALGTAKANRISSETTAARLRAQAKAEAEAPRSLDEVVNELGKGTF